MTFDLTSRLSGSGRQGAVALSMTCGRIPVPYLKQMVRTGIIKQVSDPSLVFFNPLTTEKKILSDQLRTLSRVFFFWSIQRKRISTNQSTVIFPSRTNLLWSAGPHENLIFNSRYLLSKQSLEVLIKQVLWRQAPKLTRITEQIYSKLDNCSNTCWISAAATNNSRRWGRYNVSTSYRLIG